MLSGSALVKVYGTGESDSDGHVPVQEFRDADDGKKEIPVAEPQRLWALCRETQPLGAPESGDADPQDGTKEIPVA